MPNNPARKKARLSLPPAGIKIARKVLVTGTIRLNNKFFETPELTNPAGGPALIGNAGSPTGGS